MDLITQEGQEGLVERRQPSVSTLLMTNDLSSVNCDYELWLEGMKALMKTPHSRHSCRAGGLGLERTARWRVQQRRGSHPLWFVAMEKALDGFNTAVPMSPPRCAMTSWTGSSK